MINIKSYPQHIESYFKKGKSGEIHSVFDNTMNFMIESRLVGLSSNELVNTPMSIQLNVSAQDFQQITFKVKDKVFFNQSGIEVSGYFFNKENALIKDEVIVPFVQGLDKTDSLFQLKQTILEILSSDQVHGEMVHAMMKLHGKSHNELSMVGNYFVAQLHHIQQASSSKKKLDVIVDLLGAGEGLTPSGDDFITGILAILHYLSLNQSNALILIDLVDRLSRKNGATTAVSQEYLNLAMTGRFNDYVHTMFKQHQVKQPIDDLLQKISAIGHSSGSDFLVGMYFGLETGGI